MKNYISAQEFCKQLNKAGFKVPKGCRRIVIDVCVNEPVTIFYETFVDKDTLDVAIDALIKKKNAINVKSVKEGGTP